MKRIKGLTNLGRMAVFYVPVAKLTPDVATRIDQWLLNHFNGFTKITQHIEGRYVVGNATISDDHVRYEVSFQGKKRIPDFIEALRGLCEELGEESLYLTMGQYSYLVKP